MICIGGWPARCETHLRVPPIEPCSCVKCCVAGRSEIAGTFPSTSTLTCPGLSGKLRSGSGFGKGVKIVGTPIHGGLRGSHLMEVSQMPLLSLGPRLVFDSTKIRSRRTHSSSP